MNSAPLGVHDAIIAQVFHSAHEPMDVQVFVGRRDGGVEDITDLLGKRARRRVRRALRRAFGEAVRCRS